MSAKLTLEVIDEKVSNGEFFSLYQEKDEVCKTVDYSIMVLTEELERQEKLKDAIEESFDNFSTKNTAYSLDRFTDVPDPRSFEDVDWGKYNQWASYGQGDDDKYESGCVKVTPLQILSFVMAGKEFTPSCSGSALEGFFYFEKKEEREEFMAFCQKNNITYQYDNDDKSVYNIDPKHIYPQKIECNVEDIDGVYEYSNEVVEPSYLIKDCSEM